MLLLGIVGTTNAIETTEKIVFQAPEITDQKLLQERMDKGITDDPLIKVKAVVDGDVFTDDSGQKWKVVAADVKNTAQKLREVVRGTNRQQDFVVHSSVKAVIVPMESGNNLPIEATPDGGPYEIAQLNQTSYISWEDGITANPGGYTGGTATKFSSTKAKITRNDTSAALVSLQVGQEGFGLSSTTKTGTYSTRSKEDQRNISGPSSGTYYTKSASNTNYWWWVKPGTAPSAAISGYANATVTRGSNTYYFSTLIYRGL